MLCHVRQQRRRHSYKFSLRKAKNYLRETCCFRQLHLCRLWRHNLGCLWNCECLRHKKLEKILQPFRGGSLFTFPCYQITAAIFKLLILGQCENLVQIYFNSKNFWKHKTYLMYHQTEHSEILCSAHNTFMCLCGSRNKQRLFLYTKIPYLFL